MQYRDISFGYPSLVDLSYNPEDTCELPRIEREEIQPLTEQDISAFLQAIEKNEPYRDLFTVTLFAVLRDGKVCELSWNAVNFEDGSEESRSCNHVIHAGRVRSCIGENETGKRGQNKPLHAEGKSIILCF